MPQDRNDLGGMYSDAQTSEFAKKLAGSIGGMPISGMGELQNEANKMAKAPDNGSYKEQLKAESINDLKAMNAAKMPAYIGTKVVCATPMTEINFLMTNKGKSREEIGDLEDMAGYLVVYEDGYKSWSPKGTFERSYRKITDEEKRLI